MAARQLVENSRRVMRGGRDASIAMLWGICCALLCGSAAIARGAEFPYTAYVNGEQVHAMSGPAQSGEYRTDRLDRGQRVAVYKMENGWCAIRPPRGSFSWLEGRMLERNDDDLGTIRVARAPSYVGSQALNRRDRVQVELPEGEKVEILDIIETNVGGVWYKIAPPAGEFRWVAASDLSRDPPTEELAANRLRTPAPLAASSSAVVPTASPSVAANSNAIAESDPPPTFDPPRVAQHSTTGNGAAKPTVEPAPVPSVAKQPSTARIGEWQTADWSRLRANPEPGVIVPLGTSPSAYSSGATGAGSSALNSTTAGAATNGLNSQQNAAGFAAELAALDQDLASMLTEDPTAWSFGSFNKRTDALLNRAGSALERGKVRLLQNKLARFEELKIRALDNQALAAARPSSARDRTPLSAANPGGGRFNLTAPPFTSAPGAVPAPMLNGGPADSARYDAIGKLMPVLAQRPNAPKFALVDAENNFIAFVTPGQDVNLQAWVGQQVGISGERGYMPELKKGHITAKSVGSADPAALARREAVSRR